MNQVKNGLGVEVWWVRNGFMGDRFMKKMGVLWKREKNNGETTTQIFFYFPFFLNGNERENQRALLCCFWILLTN